MIDSAHMGTIKSQLEKKFQNDDVVVTEPFPFSSKLAVEHSPHIDHLFVSKFENDPFAKSIFNLRDLILADMEHHK